MSTSSYVHPLFRLIGEKLAECRRQKGYKSPEAFATLYSLDINDYTNHESGQSMYIDHILVYLNELDIVPADFFRGIEDYPEFKQHFTKNN